jgi:hypothetical protein
LLVVGASDLAGSYRSIPQPFGSRICDFNPPAFTLLDSLARSLVSIHTLTNSQGKWRVEMYETILPIEPHAIDLLHALNDWAAGFAPAKPRKHQPIRRACIDEKGCGRPHTGRSYLLAQTDFDVGLSPKSIDAI